MRCRVDPLAAFRARTCEFRFCACSPCILTKSMSEWTFVDPRASLQCVGRCSTPCNTGPEATAHVVDELFVRTAPFLVIRNLWVYGVLAVSCLTSGPSEAQRFVWGIRCHLASQLFYQVSRVRRGWPGLALRIAATVGRNEVATHGFLQGSPAEHPICFEHWFQFCARVVCGIRLLSGGLSYVPPVRYSFEAACSFTIVKSWFCCRCALRLLVSICLVPYCQVEARTYGDVTGWRIKSHVARMHAYNAQCPR